MIFAIILLFLDFPTISYLYLSTFQCSLCPWPYFRWPSMLGELIFVSKMRKIIWKSFTHLSSFFGNKLLLQNRTIFIYKILSSFNSLQFFKILLEILFLFQIRNRWPRLTGLPHSPLLPPSSGPTQRASWTTKTVPVSSPQLS